MNRLTARHLPSQTGPAAWAEILGGGPPPERLEAPITADVVVVGAGFAGLSAARRLHMLDPNTSIVVLDAARIAEGPAGRNSGFMIDIPHELTSADYAGAGDDRAMIALNRQAQAFAGAAVEEYGIPPDFFDRVGKVNGAVGPRAVAHNAALARHLEALSEPSEMLDAQAMAELTGSRAYTSGLYTPGTVMLQPAGYIRGLAAGLRADGVRIFERSPALRLRRAGTVWSVETPKGRVASPKVILSVNGYLESLGIARNRLMQVILFAAMTPVLPDGALAGQPRWGITPSDPMGTTVRRIDAALGGDRLVVRTAAALRPGMKPTQADMARAERLMRSKFAHRFPNLAEMPFEHVWAGNLCLSANGVSVTGQVEEGLFSACVQNGLGTARGTLTGIAAAELAMGVESDISRFFGNEPSPKRLPPQPFREIGGNAAIRWKERRAGAE